MSNFPAVLDTVTNLYQAVNNFSSTLVSGINAGQTAIQLVSVTLLPPSGLVSIDEEVISYASIGGPGGTTLLGCVRGVDGSSAQPHAAGSRVEARWVAAYHNALLSAVVAIENALGVLPNGPFDSVAERLDNVAPSIVTVAVPTTNWSTTHTKKRPVGVQLWRLTASNKYEQFEAPIEQVVDTLSTSQINIVLPVAQAGIIVIL